MNTLEFHTKISALFSVCYQMCRHSQVVALQFSAELTVYSTARDSSRRSEYTPPGATCIRRARDR